MSIRTESTEDLIMVIKAFRQKHKVTQQDVADRMGVTLRFVRRLESGSIDPRLSTMRRYAVAVGVLIKPELVPDEQDLRDDITKEQDR